MSDADEHRDGDDRREHHFGRRRVDRAEAFASRTIWNPQFLAGLLVVLVLIAVLVQVVSLRAGGSREDAARDRSRETIKAIELQQDQNTLLLEEIRSCTRPGGECNERNQSATAAAIQNLVRTSVASGLCSAISRDEEGYNICIQDKLGTAAN